MEIPRLSLLADELANGVGIIKQYSAEETYPIHTHDFYELVFISRGKGKHCINSEEQILSEGSLVFIRPDDVHSFKALNYFDFEMFSLGFMYVELQQALSHLELSLEWLQMPILPLHIVLEGNEKVFLTKRLEKMLSVKRPEQRKRIFRALLVQVLDLAASSIETGMIKESLPEWLSALDEEMGRRENYVAGLSKMLELCHYSQEYLNRMFKKYFNMTPTEYINAKRMIYAAELLMEGKYEIVEICDMCGFGNLSYFYAVFKKQYDCTPYRFRKSFSAGKEAEKSVSL